MAERTSEKILASRNPSLHWGYPDWYPDWWHHHGIKMQVREKESTPGHLVIKGSAAELSITSATLLNLQLRSKGPDWMVDWRVEHSPHDYATGQTLMDLDTLKTAFGFNHTTTGYSEWLIHRYGGTAAEQGHFIRWNQYLNIPGPGTGADGDPNVSLKLNDSIKKSVGELIFAELSPAEKRRWITREVCTEYFSDPGVIKFFTKPEFERLD